MEKLVADRGALKGGHRALAGYGGAGPLTPRSRPKRMVNEL